MATLTQPLRNRNLMSCKRGPEDRRPILCLPRLRGAPSVLVLKVAPDVECNVQLAPRHTGLLLALVDAWHEDDGEIEALRGFCTAADLGERYADFSNGGVSISKEAVQAYVYEIKVRIAKALSSLALQRRIESRAPGLLETRRLLGYRIDECGLEIVQTRSR